MSLWRPSLPGAERRGRPSPSPPPEDPECQPPGGKRLRLGEPGWRLPAVRRLSAAERAWAWPSRGPLLVPAAATRERGAAEETPARPSARRSQPAPPRGLGAGSTASGASEPGRPSSPDGRPSPAEDEDASAPAPGAPTPPSQRRAERAGPCCLGERGAGGVPGPPTALGSVARFVCSRKGAKQGRHDAEKQKAEKGGRRVAAEEVFSEHCDSSHGSLGGPDASESRRDSRGLKPDRGGTRWDVSDSGGTLTVTLRNTDGRGAERNLRRGPPARLGTSQSRDCNIGRILKRNRQNCGVMKNYKTYGGSINRSREKLNLLQLQAIELLGKEDYHNIKATSVHEQQLKPLIEMLGNQKFLMNIAWLNSKGENDNMLQLRYYTIQKDFHVCNSFQSFITEIFYFHESISGNQKDNRILSWCQILKCKNQIGIKNLITRSINVNIKSGILSKYIQTSIAEYLNIFKTNVAYMFNNFDSLARIEGDSELEVCCFFKWIVHLNYPKLITVEGHTVHIMRTLTFSERLEDIMKPMLKKRKPIFKTQEILEGSKKENFDSFSMTAKSLCFPIFKTYEKIPFLMDFDDMEELSLIKKSSYQNMSCLEQNMNVETWAHCSFRKPWTY
ncbi:RAD51-associated protein 2-like [Erethizon dorsatum]